MLRGSIKRTLYGGMMRLRLSHYSRVGVILSVLVAAPLARASVIYGDIASSAVFSGYGMGPGGGTNNYIAEGFTMSHTYNLQSVDIILSQFQIHAGSDVYLSIFSNGAGNTPGTDLYDLSTNVSLPLSGSPATVNYSGTGSFILAAGTTYWLELYASNPSSETGDTLQWDGAYTSDLSAFATPTGPGAVELGQLRTFSGGISATELRTSFQLNGVAVPEPSSVALAALGAVGLVALAWRQRPVW